jgi:FkbM family methyltransferase
MSLRSVGLAAARWMAPCFSSRVAQAGVANCIRFLEALQGIGTGVAFSRAELHAVFQLVAEDAPVVFDVGAHTGSFLKEALERTRSDSVIHAFEPATASYQQLLRKFGGEERARLNRCALAAVAGTGILFYDVPGSQLASLTPRPRYGVGNHSEGVPLGTLDDYCRANAVVQIHLLKLDVEGHELEVLEGAGELLQKQAIRRILFEFGGCNVDTRVFFRDIYEFLSDQGMNIARLSPGGALHAVTQYEECLERFATTNYLATL